MGGVFAGDMLGDTEAERGEIDARKHRFALAEHDGGDGEMQFVDEARLQILTDGSDAQVLVFDLRAQETPQMR